MLTILGQSNGQSGFCDGLFAPRVPEDRRRSHGRAGAEPDSGRGSLRGRRQFPQGDHQRLPARRAARTSTCGTSSPTPRPKSAASSSRSGPTCRASRSASCFRKIAAMMDKFAVIRTLADSDGGHDGYQCMTGRKRGDRAPSDGWPSGGLVGLAAAGPGRSVPSRRIWPLMYATGNATWGDPGTAGFLGRARPVQPRRPQGQREVGRHDAARHDARAAPRPRSAASVAFDRFRRDADPSRHDGRHATTTCSRPSASSPSRKLGDALDLSKEDPRIVERYGRATNVPARRCAANGRATSALRGGWSRPGARVGHAELQPLGLARPRRQELRPSAARTCRLLDSGAVGPGDRPARARAGQRRFGRGLGRVRPDAQTQQQHQPRPLAAASTPPCWPAAACGPAR